MTIVTFYIQRQSLVTFDILHQSLVTFYILRQYISIHISRTKSKKKEYLVR